MAEKKFAFYDHTLFDKHVGFFDKFQGVMWGNDKTRNPLLVFVKNADGIYVPMNAGQATLDSAEKNKAFYGRKSMQNMGEIAEDTIIHPIYIAEIIKEKLTSNAVDLMTWADKKWNPKHILARQMI